MKRIELEEIKELEAEIIEAREELPPPKTMKELYNKLWIIGAEWRKANEYIVNEGKKNERLEIPRPSVAIVAKVFQECCHFTLIGEGHISDISKLYIYHLDYGYYVSSTDLFRKLLLKYDSRLTSNRFLGELEAFIRTGTPMRKGLDDYRYIPVANGIYNIESQTLEPFSPDFIITSKIKTAFNPKARKPCSVTIDVRPSTKKEETLI